MTDPMHQQLLGHLLGALDDDEQEWLEAVLECDEEYRREWMLLRKQMAPLLAARPEIDPPSGLASQTCRLVSAYAPVQVQEKALCRKMTPDWSFSGCAARVGRLDLSVAAVILVMIGILIPPAIYGSRFNSRVASCQDKLRQVGSALAQCGYHQGSALAELAQNEKLNGISLFSAGLLDDELNSDDGRVAYPESWLATLGIDRWSKQAVSTIGPPLPVEPQFENARSLVNYWSGLWRNGTIGGLANSTPAAVAILADAPSADLPGQTLNSHDGRGRNVFFGDGHVDFLPCSISRDPTEMLLSSGDTSASPVVSVPITFVSGH